MPWVDACGLSLVDFLEGIKDNTHLHDWEADPHGKSNRFRPISLPVSSFLELMMFRSFLIISLADYPLRGSNYSPPQGINDVVSR